jgi:PEP-CTERM motif
MTTKILCFAAVCALGITTSARAQLIDADFNAAPNGNTPESPTMSGAAVIGSAGDVWNGIDGDQDGVNGTYIPLVDSNGNTITGSKWTFTTGHGLFDDTGGTTTNPTALMEDYMYGSSGNEGGTISGLVAGDTFTLVIYGAGDQSGQGDIMTLSGDMTGGNTADTLDTSAIDRDITNGIGDAYNTFTGTIGASGQIQIVLAPNTAVNAQNGDAALNGFQLQETAAPEPSTYMLVGLGIAGLVVVTARRRSMV